MTPEKIAQNQFVQIDIPNFGNFIFSFGVTDRHEKSFTKQLFAESAALFYKRNFNLLKVNFYWFPVIGKLKINGLRSLLRKRILFNNYSIGNYMLQ